MTDNTFKQNTFPQPEHDCEFFLVTDVAVHACECDHILVSDNSTQKEYVPIEQTASLQKQVESDKKLIEELREENERLRAVMQKSIGMLNDPGISVGVSGVWVMEDLTEALNPQDNQNIKEVLNKHERQTITKKP